MSNQPRPSAAQLRAAKQHASGMLGHRDGVEGVGIGDGCLRIYVRTLALAADLPGEVDGVPVECVEVGEISPRGPVDPA